MDSIKNQQLKFEHIPQGYTENVGFDGNFDREATVEAINLRRIQYEDFVQEVGTLDLDGLNSEQVKKIVLDGYVRAHADLLKAGLVEKRVASFRRNLGGEDV